MVATPCVWCIHKHPGNTPGHGRLPHYCGCTGCQLARLTHTIKDARPILPALIKALAEKEVGVRERGGRLRE